MRKTTGALDLARKYRTEHGIEMPTLKLARIMYAENDLTFNNVEHARSVLRMIEGKHGDRHRKEIGEKQFFMTEHRPRNPYKLPESDEKSYDPYYLEGKRILGLFDIHCPYHNIPALSAAIKWGKTVDPDTILLGGDVIDCHQLSDYVKDVDKRSFATELQIFSELIAVIRLQFPKAKIVFKEGNHEERYDRFLAQKAGELKGIPEFILENIIRKRIGDVDYIGQKRIIKAGDLNIIHGHEFKGGISTPVNIARGLFLKAKVSCMQGHNHASSEHSESDMNGKLTTTWSVGCLSELHPAYMPLNKWNHGFSFIEIGDNGTFQVQNKRIHKGEVL